MTTLQSRLHARRRVVGVVGAIAAGALAALWTQVVPDRADAAPALQALLIRWGHPACWALLAGASLGYALDAPRALRSGLLWGALGCYAAFLGATIL